MQIFLIRHPRPVIAAGCCYGQSDVDCEDPAPVATALRPAVPAGWPLYSSPLRRAQRLATALCEMVRTDPRLAEMHFGTWEGRRWDAIARAEIDAWAADMLHYAPPGGESVAALRARALAFAASLTGPAIAVTHAGIMRALVGHARGLSAEAWTRLEFAYGEGVWIDWPPARHDTTPHRSMP